MDLAKHQEKAIKSIYNHFDKNNLYKSDAISSTSILIFLNYLDFNF